MCEAPRAAVCECVRRIAVSLPQIAADPITEACPVLTNGEFPLVVPGASAALYLGSITVDSLAPKAYRVVFPQVSRVPSTDTNATNTCLLVFIDSAYNVPEPFDGPYNIASQTVANADIRR